MRLYGNIYVVAFFECDRAGEPSNKELYGEKSSNMSKDEAKNLAIEELKV